MTEDRQLARGERFTVIQGPPGLYRVWDAEKRRAMKDCETKEDAQEWARILNARDARGES